MESMSALNNTQKDEIIIEKYTKAKRIEYNEMNIIVRGEKIKSRNKISEYVISNLLLHI